VTSRWPLAVLGCLAIATVVAFFVIQHLKVTTPVIERWTYGHTPHITDPSDPACPAQATTVYFDLLHEGDTVDVYVVAAAGGTVRTIASDLPARIHQPLAFTWNDRLPSGRIAPPGKYNFVLQLIHQQRTINPLVPGFPLQIQTTCPTQQ
jgi:hypothetical protein